VTARAIDDRDLARLMGLAMDQAHEPFPLATSASAWIGMNALAAKHNPAERNAILWFFALDANAGADVDLGGEG
jgi:hypothetical protein